MFELSVNNGNFLWMTRGKEWGFRFLSKCSSLPSAADNVYKRVFLSDDESRFGYWKGVIFADGVRMPYVACRCYDRTIQRDQAGRRIPHEFLLLCTDQECDLLSRLTWESLILEQVCGLYSDRYFRCAAKVTDCLINFRLRPDSRIEHCDSCVALDVDLTQTIATSDQGVRDAKRHIVKPFLVSILLICLGVGYTMCLKGKSESKEGYILVGGMGSNNASMGCAPVTEEEWAKFTGKNIAPDRLHLPVSDVLVEDAERYCAWLTQNDSAHIYRLPTGDEWDIAVGHRLKEAKLDSGVGGCTKLIDGHEITNDKCYDVTFWNNYWELTSTKRGERMIVVKGMDFCLKRTEHHAEICSVVRKIAERCTNVTFRVVREDK